MAREKCPLDPYIVVPEQCEYEDIQSLRLQELPEDVPQSEMPRHILMSCNRYLVCRMVPGVRVTVCGVYSIYQASSKVI
jgi:DNA replication licensing factor MCM5